MSYDDYYDDTYRRNPSTTLYADDDLDGLRGGMSGLGLGGGVGSGLGLGGELGLESYGAGTGMDDLALSRLDGGLGDEGLVGEGLSLDTAGLDGYRDDYPGSGLSGEFDIPVVGYPSYLGE